MSKERPSSSGYDTSKTKTRWTRIRSPPTVRVVEHNIFTTLNSANENVSLSMGSYSLGMDRSIMGGR